VDTNGYVLMDSPYAISPEGPYSIYDCVYVYLCSFPRIFLNVWMNSCRYGIPKTQVDRHTCHYYKVPPPPLLFCFQYLIFPSPGIRRNRIRPRPQSMPATSSNLSCSGGTPVFRAGEVGEGDVD
jgi:hypothetical protein